MKIHPKYIQFVADSLIPLLGLFVWDWGLYFILLFYFLDLLSSEIIVHLKSKKTIEYQGIKELNETWLKWGLFSLIALTFTICIIHFAVYFIIPGIDFMEEFLAFWNYKELGIPQGYILLPLVLLMAFQQYKLTFIKANRYKNSIVILLWKKHLITQLLIILFTAFCLLLNSFLTLPEWVYVISIVFLSSLYKFKYNDF